VRGHEIDYGVGLDARLHGKESDRRPQEWFTVAMTSTQTLPPIQPGTKRSDIA
jgi:hypothetical protein